MRRSFKTLLALAAAALIPLLLALAVARPAAFPNSGQQDSYAIYSLLLPGPLWKNLDPSQTERWAIAGTTVSAADINPALAPEAALQPPQDHPKWFADAVRDYNARKNQRLTLIRDFQVDRPYVLLTPSEVDGVSIRAHIRERRLQLCNRSTAESPVSRILARFISIPLARLRWSICWIGAGTYAPRRSGSISKNKTGIGCAAPVSSFNRQCSIAQT